jgi:hypothetical protein
MYTLLSCLFEFGWMMEHCHCAYFFAIYLNLDEWSTVTAYGMIKKVVYLDPGAASMSSPSPVVTSPSLPQPIGSSTVWLACFSHSYAAQSCSRLAALSPRSKIIC